jgi:LPXTG-motif cell wall-anchored protein
MGLGTLAISTTASAHTESDLMAVPAGAMATVTLKPTHGCDDSPTVEVAIRAPVEGAVAGAVDGWTATQAEDGEGNTILEWTGGVLPSSETGAFPVSFTAPDGVGELLTFPSIQVEPAETIDDVPADALGPEQLTAIVDVDNPDEAGDGSTKTSEAASSSTVPEPSSADDESTAGDTTGDEESSVLPLLAGALVLGLGGFALWTWRRRSA